MAPVDPRTNATSYADPGKRNDVTIQAAITANVFPQRDIVADRGKKPTRVASGKVTKNRKKVSVFSNPSAFNIKRGIFLFAAGDRPVRSIMGAHHVQPAGDANSGEVFSSFAGMTFPSTVKSDADMLAICRPMGCSLNEVDFNDLSSVPNHGVASQFGGSITAFNTGPDTIPVGEKFLVLPPPFDDALRDQMLNSLVVPPGLTREAVPGIVTAFRPSDVLHLDHRAHDYVFSLSSRPDFARIRPDNVNAVSLDPLEYSGTARAQFVAWVSYCAIQSYLGYTGHDMDILTADPTTKVAVWNAPAPTILKKANGSVMEAVAAHLGLGRAADAAAQKAAAMRPEFFRTIYRMVYGGALPPKEEPTYNAAAVAPTDTNKEALVYAQKSADQLYLCSILDTSRLLAHHTRGTAITTGTSGRPFDVRLQ